MRPIGTIMTTPLSATTHARVPMGASIGARAHENDQPLANRLAP